MAHAGVDVQLRRNARAPQREIEIGQLLARFAG